MVRLYSSKWGRAVMGGAVGLGLLLGSTGIAQASTLSSVQIQAVIGLLQAFGADSTTIANVQATLSGQATSGTPTSTTPSSTSGTPGTINIYMIGNLKGGDKGDAVKYLQTLLAADSSIYPQGQVTGTFGPLTILALKNFQRKHGINAVGFVGPATLAALEQWFAANPIGVDTSGTSTSTVSTTEGHHLCAIVSPGHLIAPGWLKHNGGTTPVIPTCQTLPPGISDHHGDDDNDGHHGTSTPPVITTLAITGVTSGAVTSTGATISWATNLGASTQVDYGTTTSYGTSSALNTTLMTSHSAVLSGLMPSTTYHFRVDSLAGSQTAMSPDMTFTTSAAADVTPPAISSVNASSIASTSATISWTTNEAATSKVYYSTASPIVLSSATTMSSVTLVTGHALNLAGLIASTTYQYVVESADSSNNTTTSTALSFTTTN